MESRYQPSESDIRAVVTKRKVSGGTVSKKGRTACDVMLGLAKTCAKLKISFFYHLGASKSRDPKSPLSHASSPPFQADHHAAERARRRWRFHHHRLVDRKLVEFALVILCA